MGISMTTWHMKTIRGSGLLSGTYPLAIHSVSSRLVISSSKHRKLSRCSHNHRHGPDFNKKHIYEHQHLCEPRMRTKPTRRARPVDPIVEDHQPLWSHTWSSSLPFQKINEKFSRHPSSYKDFWEMEVNRTRRTMDHIKQAIENDPYGAIFGRRLEPLKSFERFDKTFTSLCRALFGLGDKSVDKAHADIAHETPRTMTTTTRSKKTPDTLKKPQSTESGKPRGPVAIHTKKNVTRYEFDPISGRMIPKIAKNPDVAEKGEGGRSPVFSAADTTSASETTGYMSPLNRDPVESGSQDASIQEKCNGDLATDVAPMTVVKNQSQKTPSCADEETAQTESRDYLKFFESSSNSPEATSSATERAVRELAQQESLSEFSDSDSVKPFLRHDAHQGAIQSQSLPADHIPTLGMDGLVANDKPTSSNFARLDEVGEELARSKDTSRKQEEEELDSLSASDIRASYLGKEPDLDARASQDSNESNEMLNAQTNTTGQVDASIDPGIECFQEATDQSLSSTTEDLAVSDKLQDVASETTIASDQLAMNEVQKAVPSPNSPITVPHNLSGQVNAETYRVLAFDPISISITEAETSSSFHPTDEISHPAEILNRLNNAAMFLPYFERLNNNGYEIVSGGGDVLVFRKTRNSFEQIEGANADPKKGTTPSSATLNDQQQHELNPDIVLQGSQSTTSETGGKTSQGSKSAKFLRRMLLGGVATAGTFYALGVVTEYFRTGGEDGRGIDAFTAFESERRRQE
ncbi:hypothetical protein ASPACDRAFT_81643 [Aspergillus aculeatus ATCC 16872]|uniref:Uncharacterized protein n=1 Tax=Aspergillus aculeatus (strain ATCC 16872 / CBS 172.66 / WB 5094) TaxID=690307 RepID=A0A1L9WIF6_ASPA1|nr:uncharacterized protein ASPACDRAFT_81643 [Aspergillus aculeatus ATCC 16872]OJJ95885.1 hypothetical protein ASPACDRAFT_81643 [Aspergillus aculeatus ATCC 16872]